MKLLKKSPSGPVFNPWHDIDSLHDASPGAPAVRREQLASYLGERQKATVILLAEALGYQGGHFTGLAMTSERLLLGHLRHKGLGPEMVFSVSPRRTSREDVRFDGFTEPTATIVWGAMRELGIDTRRVILWNAFPWHPYKPDKGYLSNRTPGDEEVLQKSAALLAAMGLSAPALRHPANGGAGKFRAQFAQVMKKGGK
jgi:hypothetical protein